MDQINSSTNSTKASEATGLTQAQIEQKVAGRYK